MTPAKAYSLVLVYTAGLMDPRDFDRIGRLVEDIDPRIEAYAVENTSRSSVTRKRAARLPSLIVSPLRLLAFQPERGKIYCGRPMSKIAEMEQLAAAGLPVPHFCVLTPQTPLDTSAFGEFTIVKPSYELSSFGAGVELFRTQNVRFRPPEAFPADHPGRRAPMIAQRFVDCGRPMTCRVLTFFGKPILTYVRESNREFDVSGNGPFSTADFMPAPPDYRVYSTHDPDILSLAGQAFEAFPDIPLQACDILRDKDGKLYILEINPGGATWMLSNQNAEGYRRMLGISDLSETFDAFNTCARELAARTPLEAV